MVVAELPRNLPRRFADCLDQVNQIEAEALVGWDARITTTAHALAPGALYGALAMAFRVKTRS